MTTNHPLARGLSPTARGGIAALLLLLPGCGSAFSSALGEPGTGGGSAPGPHGNPLAVTLQFSVHNDSAFARTETVRASVPFPHGGYHDLENVVVNGHQTAWEVLQRWPDGSVRVAQAQFTDELQAGERKTYEVGRDVAAQHGPFVRNIWVSQMAPLIDIGAEVKDTFGVAYRSFVNGNTELLQETPLVQVRRARGFHQPVGSAGIGRDYLTSTFYLTEFRDVPVVLVDWVLGNDYLGADVIPPGNNDPNLRPLGMIDVRQATFLVRGPTGAFPYLHVQDNIGLPVMRGDGYFGSTVMQDTYIEDGQTRRFRYLLYYEHPAGQPADLQRWRATASAMVAGPLFPLTRQQTWLETGGAGLLGGPIAGPSDGFARAEGEYQQWVGFPWFGTWGSRSDAQKTGTTGTPRNHPLSPELAHAIQGDNPRLLQKLEQMAWAQAMRPYHLYGLTVGAEQDILLWDGVPIYPGSRDLSTESLGRRALWAQNPYAAYRTMTQTGDSRAHGWEHFDHEHWSTDLLFDYWTVSGDEWAKEELRQLGQSLKGLMRVRRYGTMFMQAVRAEGWTMQGFAQCYLATGDASLKDYALRRLHEVVAPQRQLGHPSRALAFQGNYPGTGFPMDHTFYMPWQHGALLYGYLGAFAHFGDPLLLQISEEVVTSTEYAWVRNMNDSHFGFVPEGLRYYAPISFNGNLIPVNFFDGSVGAKFGDSPLGGAHTFLIGGLYQLADWGTNSTVRQKALHYASLLQPSWDNNARWNKWASCVPGHFVP